MKFSLSKTDLKLISIIVAILFVILLSWGIYNISDSSDDRKAIAKLIETNEDVRIKMFNHSSWQTPGKNFGLVSGDQIFTGNNSSAVVELASQVRLNLRTNSLITISEVDEKFIMELERGTLDIENKKNSPVYLKENSVIKIVEATNKNQIISKKSSKEVAIVEKPTVSAEITSPFEGQRFEANSNIRLRFNRKFSGKIEVAQNSNFSKNLSAFHVKAQVSEHVLTLKDTGKYFIRLLEDVLVSKVISVEVYEHGMGQIISPENNSEIVLNRLEDRRVELKWHKTGEGKENLKIFKDSKEIVSDEITADSFVIKEVTSGQYVWGISNDNRFDDKKLGNFNVYFDPLVPSVEKILVEDSRDEGAVLEFKNGQRNEELEVEVLENEKTVFKKNLIGKYEIKNLKPGLYKIKINSKHFKSKKAAELEATFKSKVIYFDGVIKNNKVEKTQEVFVDKDIAEIKLRFFTYLTPNKFTIKLLKDGADFSKKSKALISKNDMKIVVDGLGKYCIGVQAVEELQKLYSAESVCIDVKPKPLVDKLDPPGNQIMKRNAILGGNNYDIKLPQYVQAKEYVVLVYDNENKTNLIETLKSNKNVLTWSVKKSGIYYYLYYLVDTKGNKTPDSVLNKIMFPISPLSRWEDN